jgi:predicted nucleic acid-binding protein
MPKKWKPVSPDRDDDPFLWAAARGKAEFLVTKDRKHLLKLGSFRHILIGNPRDLFQWTDATYPDVV